MIFKVFFTMFFHRCLWEVTRVSFGFYEHRRSTSAEPASKISARKNIPRPSGKSINRIPHEQ